MVEAERTVYEQEQVSNPEDKAKEQEKLFYKLWDEMPDNMNLYKKLVDQRNGLHSTVKAHTEALDEIDIEMPINTYPQEVSRSALGLFIVQKRLRLVEKQIHDLDYEGGQLAFFRLRRREIEVEPLSDNAIYKGTGYRRSTKPVRGFISELRLEPSDGGSLEFTSRRKGGAEFSAYPLFDPFDDKHPPRYRITLV